MKNTPPQSFEDLNNYQFNEFIEYFFPQTFEHFGFKNETKQNKQIKTKQNKNKNKNKNSLSEVAHDSYFFFLYFNIFVLFSIEKRKKT